MILFGGSVMTMSDGEGTVVLTEEIELAGSQLVEWVKHLFKDARLRQVRIKAPGGTVVVEGPGGAPGESPMPWLAIVGAVAAVADRVRVEIVRAGSARPAQAAGNGNGDGAVAWIDRPSISDR
jgi:hypothetical protein